VRGFPAVNIGDDKVSEIPHLQEPKPEDFGIAAARINHLRQVNNSDMMTLAGIPITAASILGAFWVYSHTFLSSAHPFWPFAVGAYLGVQSTIALHERRVSRSRGKPDYPSFVAYENAIKNYRDLQRTIRLAAEKKRRRERWHARNGQARDPSDNDGAQFEIDVVKILFSKRYEVEHNGGSMSGDGGVDFKINHEGKKIIGQCKAHASYISAGYVRELFGTMLHENADEAWLVCKTGYYRGARSFASGKPIRLMTMRDLERLPDAAKPAVNP
jgi:hypothetical protein